MGARFGEKDLGKAERKVRKYLKKPSKKFPYLYEMTSVGAGDSNLKITPAYSFSRGKKLKPPEVIGSFIDVFCEEYEGLSGKDIDVKMRYEGGTYCVDVFGKGEDSSVIMKISPSFNGALLVEPGSDEYSQTFGNMSEKSETYFESIRKRGETTEKSPEGSRSYEFKKISIPKISLYFLKSYFNALTGFKLLRKHDNYVDLSEDGVNSGVYKFTEMNLRTEETTSPDPETFAKELVGLCNSGFRMKKYPNGFLTYYKIDENHVSIHITTPVNLLMFAERKSDLRKLDSYNYVSEVIGQVSRSATGSDVSCLISDDDSFLELSGNVLKLMMTSTELINRNKD